MPSLGADMEDGTVVEWLRQPGDTVARGDIIAVIETDKGAIEIEVFEAGTMTEIVVPVGEKVPVGTVLAMIDSGDAPATPTTPEPKPAEPKVLEPKPAPAPVTRAPAVAPAAAGGRLRISPVARRVAAECGIDLTALRGSGPDGAISLADVEAAPTGARPAQAAPARRTGFDPAAMRKAIGGAMARAKREIPHYYLRQTIDMNAAMTWLAAENERKPVAERLLAGVLLLKATALALREAPALNGFWTDDGPEPSGAIHVGWAIALRGGGLMAPAIHDADEKSLGELMAAMRDLVTRARTGRIRGSEMTDPTVTITSLGERGVEEVIGVIYPPQLALVGFGGIREQPVAVDGAVVVRPTVVCTLSADHRGSDGAQGSRLLATIDRLLQQPEAL